MTSSPLPPTPESTVSIHLLDSSRGHAVHTWTFAERSEVQIGRLPENDVVVTDPAVSRLHAVLKCDRGQWQLESVGKHGVFVDGDRIEALPLKCDTVFRLGPNGPSLKFDMQTAGPEDSQQCRSTIEFDAPPVIDLNIDRQLAAEQVRQITDDQSFQHLLARAASLRRRRSSSPTDGSTETR